MNWSVPSCKRCGHHGGQHPADTDAVVELFINTEHGLFGYWPVECTVPGCNCMSYYPRFPLVRVGGFAL